MAVLLACPDCHRQYDVGAHPAGAQVRCLCGRVCSVPAARARRIEMLHCSNCGGRLAGGKKACEYCSAEIRLADRGLGPACPECFAATLHGAKHCSACGVALRPEGVLRALLDRRCPRCKHELSECESEKARYVECTACGGLWLDEELFQRIAEDREPGLAGAFTRSAPRAVAGGLEQDVRYLPCPVCGELMHRRNFAACSGVVLDWCRGHGWWFDAQELERVSAFLARGGLERARAVEHERRKLELRELERKASRETLPLGRPQARSRADRVWGLLGDLFDLIAAAFGPP